MSEMDDLDIEGKNIECIECGFVDCICNIEDELNQDLGDEDF